MKADLLYLPGGEEAPDAAPPLYAHWTCATCHSRNYLPRSGWARVEGAVEIPPPTPTQGAGS